MTTPERRALTSRLVARRLAELRSLLMLARSLRQAKRGAASEHSKPGPAEPHSKDEPHSR